MSWLNFIVITIAVLFGVTVGMCAAIWWLERKWKLDLTIPEETPSPVKPAKYTNNKKGKKR